MNETEAHRQLKMLALRWARQNGYRIAAAEVTVHEFRFRLDAAAYKPVSWTGQKLLKVSAAGQSVLGSTVIFECKQSRADFLRDAHNESQTLEELERLHQRRALYESELGRHFPTLRNGDSLFPEMESYRLADSGYEPYLKLLSRIELLSSRLHENTKFDKLRRWGAANLHYLVTAPGVAKAHELPFGWGLLERREGALEVKIAPIQQEVPDETRLMLLQRIAIRQPPPRWLEA
jgi:hypothetical protein